MHLWQWLVVVTLAILALILVVGLAIRLVSPLVQKFLQAWRQGREQNLRRQVETRPLRFVTPSQDRKPANVKVWPTQGDVIPRSVLDDLEAYVSSIPLEQIHRRQELEYRDGKWHEAEPSKRKRPDATSS